jgi:hypothetical protein
MNSPIVPTRPDKGLLAFSKASGSATGEAASALKEGKVVEPLHHIPALTRLKKDTKLDFVLIACGNMAHYEEAPAIIRCIEGLRPLSRTSVYIQSVGGNDTSASQHGEIEQTRRVIAEASQLTELAQVCSAANL